ncbi:MAG: hydrogenase maturation protease [Actinomycetes bacterium]
MTHDPSRVPGPRRTLVVGLGSMDRGDDAAGPRVASLVHDAVAALGTTNVQVVEHEDPTSLVDLMAGFDLVIIADAVRSGAAAGTVSLREVGRGEAALPARTDPGPSGTHGLGLASALELARALDRLPERVVVVGIEAVDFEHGRTLSDPVAAGVAAAVEAILDTLRG